MSDLDLISKVTGVENVANMALAITFHVEQWILIPIDSFAVTNYCAQFFFTDF